MSHLTSSDLSRNGRAEINSRDKEEPVVSDDMRAAAEEIAGIIQDQEFVKIVTHIDADGITAGSIASAALERAGIPHDIEFVKQLDTEAIERLRTEKHPLVWFTDLGSGMLEHLTGLECVICDHHVPSPAGPSPLPELDKNQLTDILAFSEAVSRRNPEAVSPIPHLNPHLFGRDGGNDLSGAGAAYLVARAMSPENMDLAALAVVGAVGDIQAARERRLTGTNRGIIADGEKAGVLRARKDFFIFGRETRPVHKLLQYSSDVLPGLSNHEENSIEFIEGLGIPQKEEDRWLSWTELTMEQQRTIVSALVRLLVERGFGHDAALGLLGEVYELSKEKRNTELRDAMEFSTLLNSCGRYKKAYVGYRVCLGDRGEYLDKALLLLKGHRRVLVDCLKVVREIGLTVGESIQYFDSGDRIPDSVVGIVASMMLSQEDVDSSMPILAFANTEEEGKVKVSARSTERLVKKGLRLNEALSEAAGRLEGLGGGHNIAAGATIPQDRKEEFLVIVEELIGKQIDENEN